MKIKGINVFESHVEKGVLALFALFVLAVLLMQTGLVGGGRTVSVGTETRPIDRALEGVRELALRRQARLQSDQVAAGVPATLPDPVEVFDRAMHSSGGPVVALGVLGRPGLLLGDAAASTAVPGVVASGESKFGPINVPAPSAPSTVINEGAIDPIEVMTIGSGLASLVPAQQPHDVRAVSVETVFDAESLRRSIESPAEAGHSALPAAMWQGKLELVEVEWARQELGVDGQWGAETVLSPLPGRPSLREVSTKADFQPGDYKTLLDRERIERQMIRRPPFYKMIAGRPWLWPSQAAKESETQGGTEITTKRRELNSVRQAIEEARRRLERTGGTPGAPPPGNPPLPPPGGGGPGRGPNADATPRGGDWSDDDWWRDIPRHWLAQSTGGGGGGGRGSRPPDDAQGERARREREQQARKRLEEQIAKLTQREQELIAELAKLGVGEGAAPLPAVFEEPLGSLASTETKSVTLWTHDLTASPGGTYRYRAVVKVTNPLYNQSDRLHEEQKSLAEAPVLVSAPSAWSAPISVSPGVVYFITSATEAGGTLGASARAAAEIYEFHYGFWRRATISLTPGDAVAGAYELPELVTFVLERDGTTAGRFVVRERTPMARKRTAMTEAFLLDTASIVSGPSGAVQAYLREKSGKVAVQKPASGDSPDGRRRAGFALSAALATSAVLGEPGGTTGGPSDAPHPPPPDAPERDRGGSD